MGIFAGWQVQVNDAINMSVCSLEFSFPRSFLVKIYQKRYSAPFIEYSASYLNANFDLKRCAVRTINDDRLAKQCQLSYERSSSPALPSEGKIVVELRKLAVDVSKSAIRISLFDIVDQPFRADLSDVDNEGSTTIDRINFTLPYSYVLKSVKNSAGSSFHLEAWYLGQNGVVLPCMLNTTCECLDDGGGDQLTFVFDGLILNTQIRPLTLKFLSSSINSKDCNSGKALKSIQSTVHTKLPSGTETATQQRLLVESLLSTKTGSTPEDASHVAPPLNPSLLPLPSKTLPDDSEQPDIAQKDKVVVQMLGLPLNQPPPDRFFDLIPNSLVSSCPPLITSNTSDGDAPVDITALLQVSAGPSIATDLVSQKNPSESNRNNIPTSDPSYSSLVHIEEIIANDFTSSQTENCASSKTIETVQEQCGSLNQINDTDSRKDGETSVTKIPDSSRQGTNNTALQRKRRVICVVDDDDDDDASCSVEKETETIVVEDKSDKAENADCLAKGHTIELIDPESGMMTIVRVSDEEDDDDVEIVGVEDKDKSKESQKSNNITKKMSEDNSEIHNIVASIVESLHMDSTPKESSIVSATNYPGINLDPPSKAPTDFHSSLGKLIGQPPVPMEMLPSVMTNAVQAPVNLPPEVSGATQGPALTAKSKQDSLPKGRSTHVGEFDPEWAVNFPWLMYDPINHTMFCQICIFSKKSNIFTVGSHFFMRDPLITHTKSAQHVDALRIIQDTGCGQQSLQWLQMVHKCHEQIQSVLALQNVFDYTWLIDFPWLMFDEIDNKVFCKVCQKHNRKTTFGEGLRHFSRRRIREHQKSRCHMDALLLDNVTLESNGEDKAKTVMRLDANSELIFSMETQGSEKEPLHWNKIAPSEDNDKTPQKKTDMNVISIKSEDSFQSAKFVSSGPYKVSPALSPVVLLRDVSKSPPDIPLNEGRQTSVSRLSSSSSQSQDTRFRSKPWNLQPQNVFKKYNSPACVLQNEKRLSTRRTRGPASSGEYPGREPDVEADIRSLLPLVALASVDTEAKSVAKRLSFDEQGDVGQTNGLPGTGPNRKKREFDVDSEQKSKEDPDSILVNYLSCPAKNQKKKWLEDIDASFWKPVVVLDDIAEDLSVLNAHSFRTRMHYGRSKERTDHESKDTRKRSLSTDSESATAKKTRNEARDVCDTDQCSLGVRLEAGKSNTRKTKTTDPVDVGNRFNEMKSESGKKLRNATECSVEVSRDTGKSPSSRKPSPKPSWSEPEQTEPSQVTFDNNYDMMEILDGLDLTDMMMCHVVLKRIAV
ncbi:uncharacterized protein [Haliotis cracherodii]|uniref:uncharacterized protein n=1 Tax=Haliotis cracherodii TaxID=6455 RepID=UPI0039EBA99E